MFAYEKHYFLLAPFGDRNSDAWSVIVCISVDDCSGSLLLFRGKDEWLNLLDEINGFDSKTCITIVRGKHLQRISGRCRTSWGH